jgi:regulator of protease activity HflC (stomatin/prohibitin superfamily)
MTTKRTLLTLVFTVKEGERALVRRSGRITASYGPGEHRLFDPRRELTVETFPVIKAEYPVDKALALAKDAPKLAAELFEIVAAGDGEAALVSLDGEPKVMIANYQSRAFWKVATEVSVERFDVRGAPRLDAKTRAKLAKGTAAASFVKDVEAGEHEAVLLYLDGAFAERLAPGKHAFWSIERSVKTVSFDLRPQPLEVSAQEILTKDRVGLRMTLTAFWRVVDPLKAASAATDASVALYRLVQFALREAVAARTLDEILAARDRIDAEVREFVGARVDDLGVAVTELGVKDVILPGDVRELINKVVDAERTAKANQIRRQEETAATRSLLNTAKLMEDNPLLLRLKELESLEKLVEKVGRIDVSAGESPGLDALLTKVWRLRPDGATAKA